MLISLFGSIKIKSVRLKSEKGIRLNFITFFFEE